ncbi:hypothetical protein JD844_027843 [Phrynosoma platyrhinos]|uniref:Protein TIC 214 n=1 Tax=Phrynosoma platyrhinos TaxID=52577 RepID=A0ABQ7SGX1_PHRPL|nr:hypothetical protein JD844_027843 [Phrynosoma platyrhinos]
MEGLLIFNRAVTFYRIPFRWKKTEGLTLTWNQKRYKLNSIDKVSNFWKEHRREIEKQTGRNGRIPNRIEEEEEDSGEEVINRGERIVRNKEKTLKKNESKMNLTDEEDENFIREEEEIKDDLAKAGENDSIEDEEVNTE